MINRNINPTGIIYIDKGGGREVKYDLKVISFSYYSPLNSFIGFEPKPYKLGVF